MKKLVEIVGRAASYRPIGSSNLYVFVILVVVGIVSYLLAGGLFPRIVKKPLNPQSVEVSTASVSGKTNTLQLINLEAVTGAPR